MKTITMIYSILSLPTAKTTVPGLAEGFIACEVDGRNVSDDPIIYIKFKNKC